MLLPVFSLGLYSVTIVSRWDMVFYLFSRGSVSLTALALTHYNKRARIYFF